MKRFVFELSEKMGMTASELRGRMSGLELRERVVMEKLRMQEHEKAAKGKGVKR